MLLKETELGKVSVMDNTSKDRLLYKHYFTPGVTVNALFITKQLEIINEALKKSAKPSKPSTKPKKGGRTKKRIRKQTHKRRRNYIKQSHKR